MSDHDHITLKPRPRPSTQGENQDETETTKKNCPDDFSLITDLHTQKMVIKNVRNLQRGKSCKKLD